jgi:hypothetical protein
MNEIFERRQNPLDPEFVNQNVADDTASPRQKADELEALLHRQQEKISTLEVLAQKKALEARLLHFSNELTNKLLSSSDLQSILSTAVEEISRELNASRGIIYLDISQQESRTETSTTLDGEE